MRPAALQLSSRVKKTSSKHTVKSEQSSTVYQIAVGKPSHVHQPTAFQLDRMSDKDSLMIEEVQKDNEHFKNLLDLIPPHSYFTEEEKNEIWGNKTDIGGAHEVLLGKQHPKSKKKGHAIGSLSSYTVTQITELQRQGETIGVNKRPTATVAAQEDGASGSDKSIVVKQEGKKKSRTSKGKKLKAKDLQRRELRLEELKEKLRVKLEEIKARKNAGKPVNPQEQKRLKKQEKKVNSKLKNKTHKEERRQATQTPEGLKSPPQNKILNQNGVPVKSKFDFSVISFGNDRQKSSELKGRDYKRLLEKVEKRKEKVEKLKEKDPEAGKKLEEKMQWQTVLSKAQGEKVKDDATLLKKAAKRKDKLKDRNKKKWGDRKTSVEDQQKKRQEKRQANLDKRKSDNREKKRKKMIKKGRIIPGF